ncbi:histidine phosphatase family protein [Boudabousia tangfeifanii]|uniref:Histidine phosphatase family protein n=1 Tax=Boudabousia tangfeifanii TaxID=1912795 RepID=A0A1D9MLC8_9ACTO|nr:histidine phosphatase family protein [Boudabousia tangfeifanii]AOZ73171.1 histidine phosphatase family protein [Boudabousia tangfeifanii]
MTHTIVHLMRHGEVANPDGVLYGRMRGFSLSPLGFEMAEAGAEYFAQIDANITVVTASPLLRAQQTAAPTADLYGLKVGSDWRLLESTNEFEGEAVNANRLTLAHPRNWVRYRNPLKPSWGEPYSQQVDRMRAAVSSAIDQAKGSEALLVSHQLPIWILRLFAEGRPLPHDPRRRQCALGSVTSLIFKNHTLVGIDYAEPSAHLLGKAADVTPGSSSASINRG